MLTHLVARSPEPQILLFFAFAGAVAVILIVMKLRQNAFAKTCRRVAEALGGTTEAPGMFEIPMISFRIEGRRATIAFSEGRNPATRVTVALIGGPPGTLRITEGGVLHTLLKLFGVRGVAVGDADFNSQYVVKTTPESLAGKIFSPERRSQAMASVRRLRGMQQPTIDLSGAELKVEVQRRMGDEAALLALAETAREFVGYLLHLDPETGIEWVQELETLVGLCPVCGTTLKEPVVRCEDCGVPHHEECWTYLGKCSVYACEGDRPRRRAA